MKHLLTAIACCLAAAGSAQTPYNPDSDDNGLIGSADLISLLALYGGNFDAVLDEAVWQQIDTLLPPQEQLDILEDAISAWYVESSCGYCSGPFPADTACWNSNDCDDSTFPYLFGNSNDWDEYSIHIEENTDVFYIPSAAELGLASVAGLSAPDTLEGTFGYHAIYGTSGVQLIDNNSQIQLHLPEGNEPKILIVINDSQGDANAVSNGTILLPNGDELGANFFYENLYPPNPMNYSLNHASYVDVLIRTPFGRWVRL